MTNFAFYSNEKKNGYMDEKRLNCQNYKINLTESVKSIFRGCQARKRFKKVRKTTEGKKIYKIRL